MGFLDQILSTGLQAYTIERQVALQREQAEAAQAAAASSAIVSGNQVKALATIGLILIAGVWVYKTVK